MATRARNLANLLGGGEVTVPATKIADIPASKLSDEISTIEQASSTDVLTNLGNTVGDQRLVGNNLYIWNGAGWYRIALINQTPTWDSGGQPASSYILDRDSPQDATVITLAASDPDGLPISYSYVTSGSMDSMATISQDSSVFTVTPKTVTEVGEGVELTGSITFRASDGVNILPSVSSFTLSFVTLIENSNHTTLLATAVDTSDNNNITDSSTNNHTITVAGDAHAGTFSPYRHGGYSTYFDGSGDYINAPSSHSSFALGTNDFTYECWFYPQNLTGCLVSKHSAGAPQWFELRVSGGYIYVGIAFSNAWGPMQTGTIPVPANKWCHVALVRNGSSFSVFVNGVLDISISNTGSISNNTSYPFRIGARGAADLPYNGYISDARLVNGTALYTSNFTPPTERLTAITNTSLLTCHLPYIADGSSNGHSITINGNTSTKAFTPYNNLEYAATDHGGSIFLDGTGDYLELPQVSALGSSHFEVSLWAYIKSSADMFLIDWSQKYDTGNGFSRTTNAPWLVLVSGQLYWTFKNGIGVNTDMIISSTVPLNQWIYVTVKRYSGDTKMYLNGIQVGSTYSNNNMDFLVGPDRPVIGANGYNLNNGLNGNITDLTVKLGTDVTDGSAPTVPTAPLSSTGSVLHVKGTGASIIDKSQSANIALIGPGTGTSTESPFAGGKSLDLTSATETYAYVDGDSIVVNANEAYTFEFWMKYIGQRGTSGTSIFDWGIHSGNGNVALFRQNTGGYKLHITGFGGFASYSTAYDSLEDGTWKHFALSRTSSGDVKSFIDGSVIESSTGYTLSVADTVKKLRIGGLQNYNAYGIKMYIQDVRLTKGLARYTANFTPPTEPLKG